MHTSGGLAGLHHPRCLTGQNVSARFVVCTSHHLIRAPKSVVARARFESERYYETQFRKEASNRGQDRDRRFPGGQQQLRYNGEAPRQEHESRMPTVIDPQSVHYNDVYRKLHQAGRSGTPRAQALLQLLRIEGQGAYAGLVSGNASRDAGINLRASQQGASQVPESALETAKLNGAHVNDRSTHRSKPGSDARANLRHTTQLVSGVTRWRRQLDYVISTLTGNTANCLEPAVRQILRLGIYEILHTKLASHAVNEHVELAKRGVRLDCAGFANAVLRNTLRQVEAGTLNLPQVPPPTTQAENRKELKERCRLIAMAHSHPTWMVTRWIKRYGQEDTVKLLEHNNSRPVYGIRVNTQITDANTLSQILDGEDVEMHASTFLPKEFFRVTRGMQDLLRCGVLRDGLCGVQDESAALVVCMLDPQPGESILDACSAPGGKTVFAASRMAQDPSKTNRILAADVNAARLHLVEKAAASAGVGNIIQTAVFDLRNVTTPEGLNLPQTGAEDMEPEEDALNIWDDTPEEVVSSAQLFDKVLLDAPCSGLGVLGKRADMRWQRDVADFEGLVELQAELLVAAARCVVVGGLLVYSTCSIEPEENQEQVKKFLASHPNYQIDSTSPDLVDASLLTPEGFMSTLPHRNQIDGAFAARLRRLS